MYRSCVLCALCKLHHAWPFRPFPTFPNPTDFRHEMKIVLNFFVGVILLQLGVVFLLLEIIFLIFTPVRLLLRRFGPPPVKPDEATALASGKAGVESRKIVIFDGVCVLCNNAGRFVVYHLPDPNLVSFLPFQDALANPHVSLARIRSEFPDFNEKDLQLRICVINGKKMYWGPDAVFTVMSWMYFPFPVGALGYFIPRIIKETAYDLVAGSRYEWFGTQPLDQNFSKSLCPYLAVRKYLEASDAAAAASKKVE